MWNNKRVTPSTSEAFQQMHDVSHGALVQNTIAMTRTEFTSSSVDPRVISVDHSGCPYDVRAARFSPCACVCDPRVGVSVSVSVQVHT